MNRSALETHRRALAAAGTFYTRNLRASDRTFLRAVHQAVVRTSALTGVEEILHSVVRGAVTRESVPMRFEHASVEFVSQPGGGYWTIPWVGATPDVIFAGDGLLVRQVDFWATGEALAFVTSPRELFPDAVILAESIAKPVAPILNQVWGPAGLTAAAWQHTGEAQQFARTLIEAAGLTPGPRKIVKSFANADAFDVVLENGEIRRAISDRVGDVDALGCAEGVLEIFLPEGRKWWRAVGKLEPIRPTAGLSVEFSDAGIRWVSSAPSWTAPDLKLRAELGADSAAFWSWADAVQIASGKYWSTEAGFSPAGTFYRSGLDFYLTDLGHERRMVLVLDKGLTASQKSAIRDAAKLHASLGFFIHFATP